MLGIRPNYTERDKNMTDKEILYEPSKVLVIEDDRGRQTSYYPVLVWNGLGCYSPKNFRETHSSGSQMLIQETVGGKISSARKILHDIGKRYETSLQRDTFLNSNLLYLIAATDGNEDTVGHSQLVARYSLLLTKAMGIDDWKFCRDIERGALLHDIGKIGIPESILRKDGPLTAKEREIVKEHPLLGYEMIEEFRFLHKASLVVLFHHESYDGQGYPYGLKREEIPLAARIFAIADTLDAITSDRPYRKGQSFKRAFDEIEKGRGTQFDPYIVDAFFSVPEEKWRMAKSDPEGSFSIHTVH
jgi:putative nucleotidyltransferase with HDIG domain